jgi:hypothetical protein
VLTPDPDTDAQPTSALGAGTAQPLDDELDAFDVDAVLELVDDVDVLVLDVAEIDGDEDDVREDDAEADVDVERDVLGDESVEDADSDALALSGRLVLPLPGWLVLPLPRDGVAALEAVPWNAVVSDVEATSEPETAKPPVDSLDPQAIAAAEAATGTKANTRRRCPRMGLPLGSASHSRRRTRRLMRRTRKPIRREKIAGARRRSAPEHVSHSSSVRRGRAEIAPSKSVAGGAQAEVKLGCQSTPARGILYAREWLVENFGPGRRPGIGCCGWSLRRR